MTKVVPIGPYHPLQEEPEFFKLHVEGERVKRLDINIGYNHRGIELLAETKTWDQDTFLVERICGICSTSHPIAYVNAVEDLLGIEAPERAKYIRSIIGELERIHSHLLWVGLAGHFLGYNTVWMWGWKYREPILELFELITGNRNHYAMMRVGGVWRDIKESDYSTAVRVLDEAEAKIKMLTDAVLDDPVIQARLKGVGVLTHEDAIAYCVVGPTARPSGVGIDVRRDHPYDAYGWVDWDVIVLEDGDVWSKAVCRLLECFESIKIIRGCLEKMQPGPIYTPIDTIPVGEGIGNHEAPRGETFHYVRSDGRKTPARHKVRAPSYQNILSNEAAIRDQMIADAILVLAAVDPCYCCTERAIVVEDGAPRLIGADLVRLSQEKTERIRRQWRGRGYRYTMPR